MTRRLNLWFTVGITLALTSPISGVWAQEEEYGQTSQMAAETEAANSYIIHAGRLIAEPGEPPQINKSIIVEGRKIVAIRDGFVSGSNVIDLSSKTVLPGLINLHTHMALPSFSEMQTWKLRRPEAVMLIAIPRLKAMLEAGFTTIRDLGDDSSIMYELADATDQGVVEGPRILASEPFFGIGNGYISAHSAGLKNELEPFYTMRGKCISRDQCRDAVREEVRRGAKVIKIRLSYLPIIDPKIKSVETVDEIKWIVEMAHQLDRTVAIHTVVGSSLDPVTNAILAGTDTVEHGPVGPDQVALMKKRGTMYVPTLLVAKAMGSKYPGLYPRIRDGAALAAKEGVTIGFGTDFPLVSVEESYQEFLRMQDAGLSPAGALKTATVNAAKMLHMFDKIGSIAVGKAADMIAVDGDPLSDLNVLGHVGFVMKDGKVEKSVQ